MTTPADTETMTVENALAHLVRDAQLFVKDNSDGADLWYELQAIEGWGATIRAALAAKDAEIARLRAVLLSIAVLGDDLPDAMPDYIDTSISVGYLRQARAALQAKDALSA